MSKVLIVEDQEPVARAIALLLELNDIESKVVDGPDAALAAIEADDIDLVIQDMNFAPGKTSGVEGTALFRRFKAARADLPVVLITAWGSVEAAVDLMKEGAGDYFEKPWHDDRLLRSVKNLLRLRVLQIENEQLKGDLERQRAELAQRYDLCGLIYHSPAIHDLVSLAVRVARADVPVLITGDHGTGKEKLAEVVQANSLRSDQPFVRVNVGALPDNLIESELFGSEAGAFTGASKRRIGRFEAADGGTLLLDEIGNLSAAGQMKLLRVLQTGEMERLGSSKTIRVDVRVLAATNAELSSDIAAGRFREDLYFRLNVIELAVPPLRQRPQDILPLARAFLAQLGSHEGVVSRLGSSAEKALEAFSWPGNVRQLQNAIQRAGLVATGEVIEVADLGLSAKKVTAVSAPGATALETRAVEASAFDSTATHSPDRNHNAAASGTIEGSEQNEKADIEKARIEKALVDSGGVVAHAADRLGLSRQALYRRMQRLGIVLERRPRN